MLYLFTVVFFFNVSFEKIKILYSKIQFSKNISIIFCYNNARRMMMCVCCLKSNHHLLYYFPILTINIEPIYILFKLRAAPSSELA